MHNNVIVVLFVIFLQLFLEKSYNLLREFFILEIRYVFRVTFAFSRS